MNGYWQVVFFSGHPRRFGRLDSDCTGIGTGIAKESHIACIGWEDG